MAAKRAQIKSLDKHSPFAVQVSQTPNGRCFVDKVDTSDGSHQIVAKVSPKSLRKLAQWILDNVEE